MPAGSDARQWLYGCILPKNLKKGGCQDERKEP
nr:MAG TPA: hypothetical protein [Caudoviricetes sp.]